jgi:hypothetical protein
MRYAIVLSHSILVFAPQYRDWLRIFPQSLRSFPRAFADFFRAADQDEVVEQRSIGAADAFDVQK